MKFVPAAVLALAMALASVAHADTPTNKADCEKSHMHWDEAHGKCEK